MADMAYHQALYELVPAHLLSPLPHCLPLHSSDQTFVPFLPQSLTAGSLAWKVLPLLALHLFNSYSTSSLHFLSEPLILTPGLGQVSSYPLPDHLSSTCHSKNNLNLKFSVPPRPTT